MTGPLIGSDDLAAGRLAQLPHAPPAPVRAGARSIRLIAGAALPNEPLHGLVIGGGDDIGAEIYGGKVSARRAHRSGARQLELKLLEEVLRSAVQYSASAAARR
jgi:putative glutamine amidotransferase